MVMPPFQDIHADLRYTFMAKKVKMTTSGRKWINHAQKNPFVSSRLFPKNHPRNADRRTPSTPLGTP